MNVFVPPNERVRPAANAQSTETFSARLADFLRMVDRFFPHGSFTFSVSRRSPPDEQATAFHSSSLRPPWLHPALLLQKGEKGKIAAPKNLLKIWSIQLKSLYLQPTSLPLLRWAGRTNRRNDRADKAEPAQFCVPAERGRPFFERNPEAGSTTCKDSQGEKDVFGRCCL